MSKDALSTIKVLAVSEVTVIVPFRGSFVSRALSPKPCTALALWASCLMKMSKAPYVTM